MRVQDLQVGDVIGSLKLLKRANSKSSRVNPSTRKRWRTRCICGKELTVPASYLVRKKPKSHCGCLNKSMRTIHAREYRIWIMMRKRCHDPRHISYKDYGGRGIKVHPAWYNWETGFEDFYAHVGSAPTPRHTLDRKDVNGNYAPGNIRWATPKEQAANKRKPQTTKTSDDRCVGQSKECGVL